MKALKGRVIKESERCKKEERKRGRGWGNKMVLVLSVYQKWRESHR